MESDDFWELVFVAAIASGASPTRAAKDADASVELRTNKRATGGQKASDKSGT